MKKLLIVLFIIVLGLRPSVKADEGMWLPLLIERLNYVDMQKMGLNLTAEEIYSVNHSSLKDAIIIFGGGCTGEIISNKGLLITNHHCGFGEIQSHSTIDHDYLKNGFWAKSLEEELANEGLQAKFLIRMEDVTQKVLSEVNDEMSEAERKTAIGKIIKKIVAEAKEETHYIASVKSFFNGNEFYMFVYEVFLDVRLVGAPPTSIGKFGADTDNWMWPRHTGDFSLFRVYCDKDGKPAKYSKDNIPYTPKHYLPISIKGVKKNDFAMILGFPGRTDRFLTSFGVKLALELKNPTIVKIRGVKLAIMREDMDASHEVNIKYATKYAHTANYWKYFIGQTKGLKRLKVYDKKKQIEDDFSKWVNADAARQKKYGKALTYISTSYDELKKNELAKWYFFEGIARGCEAIRFSRRFSGLLKELKNKDANEEKIDKYIKGNTAGSKKFFKDYNAPTDKKLLAALLKIYFENVTPEQQPALLKTIAKKYKSDFNKYAEKVFAKSIFVDQKRVEDFLAKPSAKVIEKDMVFQLMNAFYNLFIESILPEINKENDQLNKGKRLFIAGLREMNPDKIYYPDANSTMRLTYGKILDYYPSDAVHYNYFTTLKGVMEKEDPNNWEFVVPEKLKDLYKRKDFGRYGEDGKMIVGFLTTHDITGGNSGSPVLNGDGELIGLAFDGNWEAMSGDIAFEPELQRTINVDIRYVLFIIEKYAGAKNIIDELTIVEKKGKLKEAAKEAPVTPVEDQK